MPAEIVLQVENLAKKFGTLEVLKSIDQAGRRVCLVESPQQRRFEGVAAKDDHPQRQLMFLVTIFDVDQVVERGRRLVEYSDLFFCQQLPETACVAGNIFGHQDRSTA